MASKFEDDVADVLTDFKMDKINYADAIVRIENAIVDNLGLTLRSSAYLMRGDRRNQDLPAHPKG